MILIGYSGHAFVIHGILAAAGKPVTGYCDREEKTNNPFNLIYLGPETTQEAQIKMREQGFFIAIGNNKIRRNIYEQLGEMGIKSSNAVHPSAIIDHSVNVEPHGVMISAGVIINPLATIGNGSICNTGCVIEHECIVSNFAHIGPGAVLCGNVTVGENSFVGAASVVREGVKIGKDVIIGAGSVVVKDVPDGEVVAGNPSRKLIK